VRTVLSGVIKDPDITCVSAPPLSRLRSLLTLLSSSGDITANVAWRLPEVNIGIVCANAPVFRPLYLYYQGRLASQRSSSETAGSTRKILPEKGSWVSRSPVPRSMVDRPSPGVVYACFYTLTGFFVFGLPVRRFFLRHHPLHRIRIFKFIYCCCSC